MVEAAGRPLLGWCLDAFAAAPSVSHAVIAAPAGFEQALAEIAPADLEVEVVAGGATRTESVGRALAAARTEIVAVHDAARPLITAELIERLIVRLFERPDASGVIAATPVADTIKRVEGETIEATEDRSRLWSAQTPQVFRASSLRSAYASDVAGATDDAILIERRGETVLVEPVAEPNLKVTTAADLRLAELLLAARAA